MAIGVQTNQIVGLKRDNEKMRAATQNLAQLRIENASPMILNGLAVLGPASKAAETPKVLSGISIPPRKNLTVPASEEAVKALGLKQGIRVMAVDLSGL